MNQKIWKKGAALLTAAAAVLGLAGCGAAGNTGNTVKGSSNGASAAAAGTSASSSNGNLKKLDIVLDWYPNAIHTFLYEAKDKGYFADEGIDVNLISPAESVDAITFVSSGKADIGLSYPTEVVEAVEKGMDVHAIGAVTQDSLSCFTALEGSGITKDFASVKGKKIGYDGTSSSEAMIKTAAKNAGLSDTDYEMVNVGFDLVTALTTGSVDLTSGMMINDEVVTMKNNGYKVETFPYSDYGVPRIYDIVMVVSKEAWEQDQDLYAGFLRACRKGFDDMKASEDESMDIIMNEMNSDDNPLDETQQKESYETLLPYMETKDARFLDMDNDTWQSYIDWMYENKLIDKKISPEEVETPPAEVLK